MLKTCHIGQINDKHTARIKTKKALCYIEEKKKTTGTVLLKKTPQYTLSILVPKENQKETKCNVCIQVVLLWLFVQYNL